MHVRDAQVGEVERLLAEFHETEDPSLRDRAIEAAMPLAETLARRYRARSEDEADLRQVALLGLVHAVDRFDPTYPNGFLPFAVSTILGELKRHLRDRTWALRVPRPVKEHALAIHAAIERLEQGQQPVTVTSLALETGLPVEQILDGLEGYQARNTVSLDAPIGGRRDDPQALGELLAEPDDAFEMATEMAALAPQLAQLEERERRLLALRFEYGMSQSEIGRHLGVSQMHVSRLLRGVFTRLRSELADAEAN